MRRLDRPRSPSVPFLVCLTLLSVAGTPVRSVQGEPSASRDDDPSAFEETVTVTGTRIPVPLGESGRSVEVLTREEIEAHGVRSVPELLQLLPGLDVRRRGVYGVQADLSIRGSSFEQVLVLVDGVPVNNPQTGHHTLDLPVPMAAIERVEVLYGPGSALYGAGAAGGVVQIVTRGADGAEAEEASGAGEASASVELLAGDNSLSGATGRAAWRSERAGDHRLSLERVESDGHRPGTEFDTGAAFYRGELGPVRLFAGASDRDFGAQGFYSARFPDHVELTEARLAGAAWRGTLGEATVHARAAGRWHEDLFILDRNDPDLLTNHHEDRSLDLELRAVRETALGTLEAGTAWVSEDLDSTNLGDRERERWGSSAALVGAHRAWSWRGALQADRVEGSWEVHPALAVAYALGRDGSGGRLRASAGSAYRLPSFTELYYLDPATSGNAALEPEHSWTYELGYDRVGERHRVGMTVFRRDGRDLIDFVRAPGDALFRAVNLRRVTTDGVELVTARRLGTADASEPTGPTLTASYSYLDSRGSEPEGESRYVFDYLEHRAVLRAEGSGPAGLRWGASASYNRRHRGDSWVRIDARLSRSFRALPVELFVEVDNLTDERYVERAGVEMPGRWVVAGVRLGR